MRAYLPAENVRSIRVVFPCRSFTDTVRFPFVPEASGLASASSQTPGDVCLKRGARLSLAAAPSSAKSADTRKLVGSIPE